MGNAAAISRPALARTFISFLCIGLTPYLCSENLLHPNLGPASLLRPEQILIQKHIGEWYTLVLDQLRILLDQTIQRHLDRPWPRTPQRIVERCLIPDVVWPEKSEALG